MQWASMRLAFAVAVLVCGLAGALSQPLSGDADFKFFAVHINRTPQQPWPGYGVYLGNGFVITAAHVPGIFAVAKPHVVIAGQDLPASLVREGSLETVDLTLMSVDATKLPVRFRMRRMPLCKQAPYPGEPVVVVTPEGTARSHVLPPGAVPPELRGRFSTVIGDVATTGNSGSGTFDVWNQCLLGVISRKISVTRRGFLPGEKSETQDIAKYFVPASDIRAFLPKDLEY